MAEEGTNLQMSEALVSALRRSRDGVALFEERKGVRYMGWANPSFYEMFSVKPASLAGRPSDGWVESMFGSSAAQALFSKAGGTCQATAGEARWELEGRALERSDGSFGGWTLLWCRDKTREKRLEAERDDLAKKLVDAAAIDEDSGFFGPKAFWKAVGSGWALSARAGADVSVGFFTSRNAPGESRSVQELEAFCASALASTFKRTSDLIGRISENSFAVFVAGQSPVDMAKRFERFQGALASGMVGFAGISGGVPEKGSSPKDVKVSAKKALSKAMSNPAGGAEMLL